LASYGPILDLLRLEKIIHKAEDAEKQRNIVIHSSWLASDEPGEIITRFKITSRKGKGTRCQLEDMETSDLHKIACLINEVSRELTAFIVEAQGKGIVNLQIVPTSATPT
jgi:hypothetical protein